MEKGLADVLEGVKGLRGDMAKFRGSVDDLTKASEKHGAEIAALKERQASKGVVVPGLAGSEKGPYKYAFSLHDVLKKVSGIGKDKLSLCSYPEDAREKIMQGEIGTDGGFTIPPQFANELIERLKAMQVLTAAGMRMFTVDRNFGQVHMPRLQSGITIAEFGEVETPAVSTPQVELLVASAHKIAGVVEVSNDLLMMNAVQLEDALRRDFTEDGALRADLLGLRGTGASNQPRGIVNTPGIGSVDAGSPNGGPVTINLLLDLQKDVEGANSRMISPAYIMHSNVWHETLKIQQASQQVFPSVFFAPGLAAKPEPVLLGHPVLRSNQIPVDLVEGSSSNLSEVYFADFADLIQVRWGDLEIRVSREATHPTTGRSAFHNDLTVFLVLQRLDYIIRHPGSFSVATDVASS